MTSAPIWHTFLFSLQHEQIYIMLWIKAKYKTSLTQQQSETLRLDKSKVQDIFNSTAVRDVEIEILNTQYEMEKRRYSSEAGEQVIKTLLGTRRTLLNHMFVMDEQSKQLLSDFNEALKAQMIEMRQKAITLFESTIASNVPASFDLKAKCFLGYEYSKIHPVQTIRAKKMWAVMNGTLDDYMPLYWDGAWAFDMEYRNGKMGHIPSENEMLYLDDNLDNWNDELDLEMTKDMHLIHPFHNLYSHMEFSIFDLLWVRDFNIEINIEADYDTYSTDSHGDDLDWVKYDYYD